MPRAIYHIASAEEQMAFGASLAQCCPLKILIFLQGDLGTGKTTLVRGFLRECGHRGSVRSPTYTLVEPYELESGLIYHMDLYRLGDGEELEYLGLRDILHEQARVLIEWPESAGDWLPTPDLLVRIQHQAVGRALTLESGTNEGKLIIDKFQETICK